MITILFGIAILILSVVVHEVSHGGVAHALGDPTAKNLGRLTLNPLKHLDLWGSFIIPLLTLLLAGFIFGWAKPVPYNPYNLRNQRWGPALVAVAGPLSNVILALIFVAIVRIVPATSTFPSLALGLDLIIYVNLLLAVFNLVPVPPLDGSKILAALLPYRFERALLALEQYGFILVIIFIVFVFPLVFPLIPLLFRLLVGHGFVF